VTTVTKKSLSALHPIDYTFNLMGVHVNNDIKKLEMGLIVNESNFLDNVISTSDKSNTKFYLKDFKPFDISFNTEQYESIAEVISTPLTIDGLNLNFRSFPTDFFALSGNYESYNKNGMAVLSKDKTLTTIKLSSGNTAHIYINRNNQNFNLKCFSDGFCILTSEEQPTTFNYFYSDNDTSISFTTTINNTPYFLSKLGDDIILSPLEFENRQSFLNNTFKISKSIYTQNKYPTNNTIIDYDEALNIRNIENTDGNYLLHRTDKDFNVISLKNSINQNGTFASTANSLSSTTNFKVFGIRKYSSINSDISRIDDNELSLNYVFGNQEYLIKNGTNHIKTPDNMYPYEQININDTLFVQCGSYASLSPLYADRIYKYDENTIINNQRLLCTWLSGNNEDAIWVDRYYYPDLISKENALSGMSMFNSTYENEIEKLIIDNIELKNSIVKNSYFDKISDMCFKPSEFYIYDRINSKRFDNTSTIIYNPCDIQDNYFLEINKNGAFELSFYFEGDSNTFDLFSKRNNIDGGFKEITVVTNFKPRTTNYYAVSIDALNGVGYFYLNNNPLKIFSIKNAQYINKNILFGDFIFGDHVKNVRVSPTYKPINVIKFYPILDNIETIDDITISLPSGTRNSIDVFELMNNVCLASSHKSNVVDIQIKNTGLNNVDADTLTTILRKKVSENLPITTDIRNINI
jgi:hypothetical protein